MNRREFIHRTSLAASGLIFASTSWAEPAGFPVVRIPEAKRKFKSVAVEKTIQRVQSSIGNKELADPTMRHVVGGRATEHTAASTSQMGPVRDRGVDTTGQPGGVDEAIRKVD